MLMRSMFLFVLLFRNYMKNKKRKESITLNFLIFNLLTDWNKNRKIIVDTCKRTIPTTIITINSNNNNNNNNNEDIIKNK